MFYRIFTEGPAFVSSNIRHENTCSGCKQCYGPLLYSSGSVLQAHHFHEESGGIYFYQHQKLPRYVYTGWFALIEPIGRRFVHKEEYERIVRTETVRITQIKSYCRLTHTAEGLMEPPRNLKEGVVVDGGVEHGLVPLCGVEEHPEFTEQVLYKFKFLEDGKVGFILPIGVKTLEQNGQERRC